MFASARITQRISWRQGKPWEWFASQRMAIGLILLSLFFSAGCNQVSSHQGATDTTLSDSASIVAEQKMEISKDIERLLTRRENKSLQVAGKELVTASLLRDFYHKEGYSPLWFNQANRNWIISFLQHARYYGLQAEEYLPKEFPVGENSRDRANVDLLLSNGLLQMGRDMAVGRHAKDSLALVWSPNSRVPDLLQLLVNAKDTTALKQAIAAIQPQNPLYRNLQQATERFVRKYPLEDSTSAIPVQKTDSVLAHQAARDILLYLGFMDSASWFSDSLYMLALKHFQRMHGLKDDGVIGVNTALALGRSNANRYESLAITLERWRYESTWVQPFAWVCLPGFELQIIDGDTVSRSHRVVVGTRENQTPEITSMIDVLVAYPFWHVPYSISSKEILPKLKNDPTYLDRNGYTMRDRSGQVVAAESVDWSGISTGNFPYQVRQNGGNSNALGLVKFLFPNTHSVYLHDTNAKRYFDSEIRSFSHGCVRLDNPMGFAEYLLERDTGFADMDLVQKRITERKEQKIALNPGLPVYLRHFTARADHDGWPLFHLDLYGFDAAYKAERMQEQADELERRRQQELLPIETTEQDSVLMKMEAAPAVSP